LLLLLGFLVGNGFIKSLDTSIKEAAKSLGISKRENNAALKIPNYYIVIRVGNALYIKFSGVLSVHRIDLMDNPIGKLGKFCIKVQMNLVLSIYNPPLPVYMISSKLWAFFVDKFHRLEFRRWLRRSRRTVANPTIEEE